MNESLFSTEYRNILLTALDKYELSHKGYNTYDYLEDNIRPLVKDKDKDTYRLVKVGNIRTGDEEVNIWFIGYYDYSNLKEHKINEVYVGKSICLTSEDGDSNILIDKTNILFDSYRLKNFDNDKNKTTFIMGYWFSILLALVSEIVNINTYKKYSNTVIHGVKIDGLMDYIKLAIVYHLYKSSLISYSSNKAKGITVEDILKRTKLFKNKEDFIRFVSNVDKYRK